jgi:hypothetical protein
VRANPKLLSASIHDLYFFAAAGFLALVASKDAFDRAHKNIVFMEGFNVCVWAEWKWLYLHSQQNPHFIQFLWLIVNGNYSENPKKAFC